MSRRACTSPACARLPGACNPEVQLGTHVEKHTFRRRRAFTKRASTRRAHPMPRSARIPSMHAPHLKGTLRNTHLGTEKEALGHPGARIKERAPSRQVHPIPRSACVKGSAPMAVDAHVRVLPRLCVPEALSTRDYLCTLECAHLGSCTPECVHLLVHAVFTPRALWCAHAARTARALVHMRYAHHVLSSVHMLHALCVVSASCTSCAPKLRFACRVCRNNFEEFVATSHNIIL